MKSDKPKFKRQQVVALQCARNKTLKYVRIEAVADNHPVMGWRYEIAGDRKYLHPEYCLRGLTAKEQGLLVRTEARRKTRSGHGAASRHTVYPRPSMLSVLAPLDEIAALVERWKEASEYPISPLASPLDRPVMETERRTYRACLTELAAILKKWEG